MSRNLYPQTGPLRGLIRRVRDGAKPIGRDLVGRVRVRKVVGVRICPWCEEPNDGAAWWHELCVAAHSVARGVTNRVTYSGLGFDSRGWVIVPADGCEECGNQIAEVDHRLALSVAVERRRLGDRRWWRAWTPSNLRWLCQECHKKKTAEDRHLLADMRSVTHRVVD